MMMFRSVLLATALLAATAGGGVRPAMATT